MTMLPSLNRRLSEYLWLKTWNSAHPCMQLTPEIRMMAFLDLFDIVWLVVMELLQDRSLSIRPSDISLSPGTVLSMQINSIQLMAQKQQSPLLILRVEIVALTYL